MGGYHTMDERRKSKRSELHSKLIVKRLDGTSSDEVVIDIIDVSKTGIGFESEDKLEIGGIYEAYLTIWTKEVIHAFLEIRRIEKVGSSTFNYGAIFIGMPEMDMQRIQVYQTVEENT
ncbi:MAG: PilZ domain-containing protein [Lachnospiraceae bacterium]|jgi:hypothetical protein|nr:PilZ domain-containing protein [Lachnospiraceae bacterium]